MSKGVASVSLLLGEVLRGSETAFSMIVERFLPRFIKQANRRLGLNLRKVVEAEDLAISAFKSLWRHASSGRADPAGLSDREDLLRLLATITRQKVLRARRFHTQLKRNVSQMVREADLDCDAEKASLFQVIPCREPGPEWLAAFNDTLDDWLSDLRHPQPEIVRLRLENWQDEEIARKIGVSRRTVERHMSEIRSTWRNRIEADG
ncbi:ECF-type sigma factor [soil metagenome]